MNSLFNLLGQIIGLMLRLSFFATFGVAFFGGRWLAEWWRRRAAGLPYIQNTTGTHGTAHFADPKKAGLVLTPEKEEVAPFLVGYIVQPTGFGRLKSVLVYTITWQLLVGCVIVLLAAILFGAPAELTNSVNFNSAALAALGIIGGGIVLAIYNVRRSRGNE